MTTRIVVLFCTALFSLPAWAQTAGTATSQTGLDVNAIDKGASPCQDFYQYACGSWTKNNPIPADESSWGRFNELHDRIEATLHTILDDAAQHEGRSEEDAKLGGFYQSCLNVEVIDARGLEPATDELKRIADIASLEQLANEVARLQDRGTNAFFSFASTPDPKDARRMIADLDQGGIGLPERDYYFRADDQSEGLRKKYVQHITRMLQLSGEPAADAAHDAAVVMAVETELARASLDVTSRRDPELLVHEMSKEQLSELSPQFDFNRIFLAVKTPEFTKLNVDVPSFITALNKLTTTEKMENLRLYLKWQYLHTSAPRLSKPFVDENFDFFGRTLQGQQQDRPRWKRCVDATDEALGDALGKKFVEQTFGHEGKDRTLQLVHEIEHQMSEDIQSITWMSSDTKQQALQKLHAVADKIGYPEKWKNYSSIKIDTGDYFGNRERTEQFESRRVLDRIGKPVDRREWSMTPPTVNAYYDPTQNNINFPAGILQPPFYSNKADDAVNYGAIGMVVGHELTHGFDDQGRKYDADGNLKDWWQKSDATRYEKLSGCLVNEYNSFTVVPKLHVNGQLTLGENTADNGGIRLAYRALLEDLAQKTVPLSEKRDGYTAQQRFFLGFAQVWCANVRPEAERELVQTDPHSPARYRVNGVVANTPEFAAAFGCKSGDPMYPANPCRVW